MNLKQLKLHRICGLWKADPTCKHPVPPALCGMTMNSLFKMPASGVVYATISTKKPTDKKLLANYLEFRYDENGFLDIRHPWDEERWEFMPSLSELDSFIRPRIKRNKRHYVWFEVDG